LESELFKKQVEFTKNVALLLNYLNDKGYKVTLGETFRTKEQQEIYFKQGKSKTMKSKHLERLAIDLNIFKNGELLKNVDEYYIIGKYWQSLNPLNVYGGFWKSLRDFPHFEMN